MERWEMCSGRAGLGCGGGGYRVKPSSGGPGGSGHGPSRSLSEEKLLMPTADAPDCRHNSNTCFGMLVSSYMHVVCVSAQLTRGR